MGGQEDEWLGPVCVAGIVVGLICIGVLVAALVWMGGNYITGK